MNLWTRRLACSIACAAIGAAVAPAAAAPPTPATPASPATPATPATPAAPNPPSAVELAQMPMARIDRPILLDEQIATMRDALGNFNSVIVRDPGVPGDYPMIPAMSLKNVSVGQFLEFLQETLPGVIVRKINGPTGPLFAIRIRPDEAAIGFGQNPRGAGRLRLYRLAEVINALAVTDTDAGAAPATRPSRAARVKEATNHVLSLLQAALEEVEPNEPYVVKIHEPTLTLLFKGNPAQQAALQDALMTLHPEGRWSPSPSSALRGVAADEAEESALRALRGDTLHKPKPKHGKGPSYAVEAYEEEMRRQFDHQTKEMEEMRHQLAEQLAQVKAQRAEVERRNEVQERPTTQRAKD